AAADRPVPPPSAAEPVPPRRRARGLRVRPWMAVVVVLALLLVAAWLLWPGAHPLPEQTGPGQTPQVLVEELPADRSARPDPAAGSTDAADRAMLADPDLAIARDADFYAWLAAGQPLPRDESEPPPATTAPLPDEALETVDAE
ncbi:hypothetical protein LRX76_08185, partial [Stenotrophomonas sp. MMGLT7]|nr:hypothetical protein [Stenotrophomonas sp. MMGLT7]